MLALGQLAASVADYHGPTLALSKGKAWEQPASWVQASSGRVSSEHLLPADGVVLSTKDEAPPPPPKMQVAPAQLLTPRSIGSGGIGASPAAAAAARRAVDVSGLDEGHAARAWVLAVLELDSAYASESEIPLLQDLLHSGALLCRVMNAVRPGTIKHIKESEKAWDHLENVGNYIKACEKLHISPIFEPPDLVECKNLRCVAQNVHALARAAAKLESYAGPVLAATHERMML